MLYIYVTKKNKSVCFKIDLFLNKHVCVFCLYAWQEEKGKYQLIFILRTMHSYNCFLECNKSPK
jgi:hypothetical protein